MKIRGNTLGNQFHFRLLLRSLRAAASPSILKFSFNSAWGGRAVFSGAEVRKCNKRARRIIIIEIAEELFPAHPGMLSGGWWNVRAINMIKFSIKVYVWKMRPLKRLIELVPSIARFLLKTPTPFRLIHDETFTSASRFSLNLNESEPHKTNFQHPRSSIMCNK